MCQRVSIQNREVNAWEVANIEVFTSENYLCRDYYKFDKIDGSLYDLSIMRKQLYLKFLDISHISVKNVYIGSENSPAPFFSESFTILWKNLFIFCEKCVINNGNDNCRRPGKIVVVNHNSGESI